MVFSPFFSRRFRSNPYQYAVLFLLLILSAGCFSCSPQAKILPGTYALNCEQAMPHSHLEMVQTPQCSSLEDKPGIQDRKPMKLADVHNSILHKVRAGIKHKMAAYDFQRHALALVPFKDQGSVAKSVRRQNWIGKNGLLSYILLILTLIIILSLVIYLLTTAGGVSGFLAFAIGGGIGIALIIIYMATHPVG